MLARLDLSVAFRLPTMTRAQARGDTRYVMSHKFRSYWRAGYRHRVSCSLVSRTRQRCKVSMIVGDLVLSGRVTVYMKRDGDHPWALDHYRAHITIYDEYCHLVNKRRLSDCTSTRRRSGLVYG